LNGAPRDRSARRRTLFALAALAAAQALGIGIYVYVEETRHEREGELTFRFERVVNAPRLPSVDLERADGSRVSSADLHGKHALIHFWATWCPPCREELPGLLQLGREQPGLEVVAITVDPDWAAVRAFFGGTVPPEVLRDPSGALVKAYEVGTLPDTYLVRNDGAALLRFSGARDWQSRAARELLTAQLRDSLPSP
jgi:thiol-disulfide isomerase/thioredoxin